MRAGKRAVLWSPEALADLEEIWTYYAQVAGLRTADEITRRIGNMCRVLEEQPLAGRSRDELRLGVRSIAAAPHVIFYRLLTDAAPEVVRVLDGRRDIEAIFSDE